MKSMAMIGRNTRFFVREILFALMVVGPSILLAKDVAFKKKVDPGALQAQLRGAGYTVNFIDCSGENCTIHMPSTEQKDPMPIVRKYVFVDARKVRRQKISELQALYDKWLAGTITDEEKDLLLKQAVGMILGR